MHNSLATVITILALAPSSLLCASAQHQGDRDPRTVTLATLHDFRAPVAAVHDTKRDVYLVSNINGEGTARDGNGSISIVSPDGFTVTPFVEGGRGGAVLNAPKGLAIAGDVLWVADIDHVRAFDRESGKPLRDVDLAPLGAIFLNGVAAADDGGVYVTDTRL